MPALAHSERSAPPRRQDRAHRPPAREALPGTIELIRLAMEGFLPGDPPLEAMLDRIERMP